MLAPQAFHRRLLILLLLSAWTTLPVQAQELFSHYEFNGNLENSSEPTEENGMAAPDGIFMEGTAVSNATPGTATYVRGVDGTPKSALWLDGINDWVDITTDGHPNSQTLPDDFFTYGPGLVSGTIVAWVKASPIVNASERWLLGNVNSNDFQSIQVGWNGGQLETTVRAADTPTSQFTIVDGTHATEWADNSWHHLAISWHGQFSTGGVFIDGEAVDMPVTSGSSISSANTQTVWEWAMSIGARNNAGILDGFWQGAIDDLQIYGEALSQQDVQSLIDDTVVATADFDEDGDVDGADFVIWQQGYGVGTTLQQGDANEDMLVNLVDLEIWKGYYGQGVESAPPALEAIPEPNSAGLLLVGTFAMVSGRWRGTRLSSRL